MKIIKQIWKRKIVFITFAISVFLLGAVFSLIIKPTYKAEIDVAIQPTDVISGFSQDTAAMSEYLVHQAKLIKSNEVVDDAIDQLHLRLTDVLDQKNPRGSFLKHIKIKLVGNSIMKLTATARSPQLAAGMASQLANSFLKLHKEASFSVSKAAMEWLSESNKIAKELKETENKLLDFIKENDMQDPQEQLNYYQERADQLIKEKAQLLIVLDENKKLLQKLQEPFKEKDAANIITRPLDSILAELLGNYKREYMAIQSDIDRLLVAYKPDHPRIIELNQQKASIIEDVNSKIKELLIKSKTEVKHAKDRITEIEAEIEKGKKEYSDLIDKKRKSDILKVKLDNLTKLYEKAKEQLSSGGISVVSVSIVGFANEAGAPVTEIKPIKMFLIIFTAAGIAIGILFTLFLERSSMQRKAPSKPPENIQAL